MEEKNTNGAGSAAENSPPQKPKNGFSIVGYNLAILAAYTIFSRLIGDGGFIIDALLLVIHVFTCLILALTNRSWMWVLAAVLVLAIGFSTCVYGGLGIDKL
jgi:hypothetical protein